MSWFQDSPHRWPSAALPLAYAVACVEVVSKNSEKARVIYQQIIELWIEPELKDFFKEIASIIPESEIEKVKNEVDPIVRTGITLS
ncbi:MAG: hypothetical protein PHU23_17295 [Dehalococcoidales bacterium]|nr:hypothetical protein [Dehalococcoidales bacterium]